MPIQIRCTCQQILAVDEAHQGQVVGCPYCGTQLTVPVMQQAPAPPGYAPPPQPGFPQQPPQGYQQPGPPPGFPPQNAPAPPGWQNPSPAQQPPSFPSNPAPTFPAPGPAAPAPAKPGPVSNAPSMPFLAMDVSAKSGPSLNDLTSGAPNVPGDWDESAPEDPRFWHIPCPNGHILETPEDMLDQDVLCPFCETQFTLRKFQSVEETEKRERLRELREEKAGQFWLKLAIGIAAVVILGIIVMIAISANSK